MEGSKEKVGDMENKCEGYQAVHCRVSKSYNLVTEWTALLFLVSLAFLQLLGVAQSQTPIS